MGGECLVPQPGTHRRGHTPSKHPRTTASQREKQHRRRAPGVPPEVPQMGHAVARCRLGNNAQGAWVESTGPCHTPLGQAHARRDTPSLPPRGALALRIHTPHPSGEDPSRPPGHGPEGALGHLGKGLPSPDLSSLIGKMGTLTSPLRGKRNLNKSNNAAAAHSLQGSRTLPQRPQEEGQRPVHRAEPEDHQASSRS